MRFFFFTFPTITSYLTLAYILHVKKINEQTITSSECTVSLTTFICEIILINFGVPFNWILNEFPIISLRLLDTLHFNIHCSREMYLLHSTPRSHIYVRVEFNFISTIISRNFQTFVVQVYTVYILYYTVLIFFFFFCYDFFIISFY